MPRRQPAGRRASRDDPRGGQGGNSGDNNRCMLRFRFRADRAFREGRDVCVCFTVGHRHHTTVRCVLVPAPKRHHRPGSPSDHHDSAHDDHVAPTTTTTVAPTTTTTVAPTTTTTVAPTTTTTVARLPRRRYRPGANCAAAVERDSP